MKDVCGYLQLTQRVPLCDGNCEKCEFTIRNISEEYRKQFFDCYYDCLVGDLPTKEYCKRGCDNCTYWLQTPKNVN